MNFRTKVQLPTYGFEINHKSLSLMMGSCFAENMAEKMKYLLYPTVLNPFGILYNPASIANAIKLLLSRKTFEPKDLRQYNGLYYSLLHHSRFSSNQRDICLNQINTALIEGRNALKNVKQLFITFGTSWIYKEKSSQQIVSNCHKLPAKYFERHQLSLEDIKTCWYELIVQLQSVNPRMRIIFTVSPIRHIKDGLIENSLSKARLIESVHFLTKSFSKVHYFPSYEIMMDDLRDYRFYKSDMLHPSDTAIEYIWETLFHNMFDHKEDAMNKAITSLRKAIAHRPFQSNSPEYKMFIEKSLEKLLQLKKTSSFLELSFIESKLIEIHQKL